MGVHHQHDHGGHHGHHHDHHHHHQLDIQKVSRNLIIGIGLNLVYVVAEFAGGFFTGSLALVADAGHNFSDASSLFLALIAFRLIKVKTTKRNTYGHRKTSILISVFNSLLIVFTVGMIVREALERFQSPPSFDGLLVTGIAAVGVVVNFATAYLFMEDREKDINVRSAYIHMLADGLVSLGVIVSGVIIHYTGAFWIDPAISIVIAALVFYTSWGLMRESFRLATDAVPRGISVEEVKRAIESMEQVKDFHHIHVWPLSTTENALTAHLAVSDSLSTAEIEKLKHEVRDELEHLNIRHVTLEIEFDHSGCSARSC